MPVLGLTKLDAVNAMLEAIDAEPVSALDTGGASIQAKAERILDRVCQQAQSWGWPDNAIKTKKSTSSGSTITLPVDTLRIASAGPAQHRNLVLKGDKLYDADTDALVTAGDVFLDITRELSF